MKLSPELLRILVAVVVLPTVVTLVSYLFWGVADFEFLRPAEQSYFGWNLRAPAYGSKKFFLGGFLILIGAFLLIRQTRRMNDNLALRGMRPVVRLLMDGTNVVLAGEALILRSIPLMVVAVGYPIVRIVCAWLLLSTTAEPDDARRLHRNFRRASVVILLPVLFLAFLYGALDRILPSPKYVADKQPDELRVHFLNIGSGHCSIVECPGKNSSPIIYDCGSPTSDKNDRELIGIQAKDYLDDILQRFRKKALSDLQVRDYISNILDRYKNDPIVVLSHPHGDHVNLISTVTKGRPTKAVFYGGSLARFSPGTERWIKKRNGIGFENSPGYHNDGRHVDGLQCGDAESHILTVNVPNPGTPGGPDNPNSLVLSITYGDFRVIFPGDAAGITEASALRNYPRFSSDFWNVGTTIVQAAHHGGSSIGSSSIEWVKQLGAKVVVYNVGEEVSNPSCVIVEKFRGSGFLLPAGPHLVRCGEKGWNNASTYSAGLAEYSTHTNGLIVITGNRQGLQSVECSESPGCGPRRSAP